MYRWAEWSEVFPDEQHGFRVNRSTETAIRVLQNIISDTLSEAKTPLYVAFVDFAEAFDSIDRTLLFGKLQCSGISTKFVKALWPLINENYVQIISGRNVSDKILQTKGIPQGQCLSPHLYSMFTADMPTAIKHDTVDNRTQCIVYVDDVAICCHVESLQACLDNLLVYCTRNLLKVNVSKTKIVKFRRGGRLSRNDKLIYNNQEVDFVSKCKYLGVMSQTKGGNSEHLEMLKRKGISACARIANQMPLNKMLLLSLERLFRAVVIPSCTYGLSAISNQLCEDNYDFLDVVQGRLVKLWYGVSKFASTSSLVNAIEWEKASNLVRTSHATHIAIGPVSMSDCTLSFRPNFATGITRRNIGLWLSNGLHDLFCQSRKCYTPAEVCVCKFCNSPADHKSHIIHCRWATKDEPFQLNVSNINMIVKMLQCMNTP